MSTTAVATIPQVPAYLQQYVAQHADENASAAGGIKAGSWPRISIGGSKFSIKVGGEKILIADPNNPQLPKMQLELVVVGHNPGVSKTYYPGDYVEGDDSEPACSSDDGLTPDDGVPAKQHVACATCPQNQWGSKISRMSGKQIKACSDSKRLVVLQAGDLDGDAYELSITAGALKDWANYVRDLDKQRIPVSAVVTHVFFDPAATYPKMLFKFGGFLSAEQLAIVDERKAGDDVQLIASPRRTGGNVIPIQPVAATPAAAPANVAPAAPAPAAAAPAPAPVAPPPPPPAAVDPYAGTAPHVKPAVEAAGGLGTPTGQATYKALTGKDAPVAVAPAAAPAAPPPAPKPVDPYEGLPGHVKLAVDAAGGLGTTAGDATYAALAGKPAPGGAPTAAAAPAAPKRGRKSTPAAAPVQPTPPVTAAPAAPAATTFSQAPAAQVAGGALDIEKMLAAAMAQPTA